MTESFINLLKKSKMSKKIRFFTFMKKIQKAFMKLKKIFETVSLLMHFNFQRKMQIKANALRVVTKAILLLSGDHEGVLIDPWPPNK